MSGLSLCTNSTKSNVAIGPTGVKSRDQSYGSALNIDGAMAFWLLTQSIEWPSGSARATASAAVAPPAPGMFSMMTGCPIDFDITSPMARPAISPRPPGPKPITIFTVRDGNSCAAAGSVRPITTAHAESHLARRSTFISPSSQVFSSYRLIGANGAGDISLLSCLIR